MKEPQTISVSIHLVVDSAGRWFAYGSGFQDDDNFPEQTMDFLRQHAGYLDHTSEMGQDDEDVEHFTVLAEIPIPDHVVFASAVKPKQRELFTETPTPC